MYRPRCLRPAAKWGRCRWPCPGSSFLGPLAAASAVVRADLHEFVGPHCLLGLCPQCWGADASRLPNKNKNACNIKQRTFFGTPRAASTRVCMLHKRSRQWGNQLQIHANIHPKAEEILYLPRHLYKEHELSTLRQLTSAQLDSTLSNSWSKTSPMAQSKSKAKDTPLPTTGYQSTD